MLRCVGLAVPENREQKQCGDSGLPFEWHCANKDETRREELCQPRRMPGRMLVRDASGIISLAFVPETVMIAFLPEA